MGDGVRGGGSFSEYGMLRRLTQTGIRWRNAGLRRGGAKAVQGRFGGAGAIIEPDSRPELPRALPGCDASRHFLETVFPKPQHRCRILTRIAPKLPDFANFRHDWPGLRQNWGRGAPIGGQFEPEYEPVC
ncbi:MAG: hypothetical protein ACWA5A_05395 [Marinibacterium sp.]